MRENKTCPCQEWKQLPTEELDKILQAELEKEYPNEEVVLPILRIIEEREKDYPVEENPEVLAILEKLSEHETSPKQPKNRRRWIAGAAALVAMVCIVVMALPRTVGAESIFQVLFRWTSSVFEHVKPNNTESYPNEDNSFATDHPGLQQLYDKVTELGVTDPVVPMWLPEGFELVELKETPMRDGGCKVIAAFEMNDKHIFIFYKISSDIATKVEKEETDVEVFESGNIKHFVLENEGNLSVTWTIDGVECLMNTNLAKEDIYTIIKSIYRRTL